MSAKGKKQNIFSFRNVILILIVVIIIASAGLIIMNPPQIEDFYSPDFVMDNYEELIGQEILVKGYYYNEGLDGEGIITTTHVVDLQTSVGDLRRLPVDHSDENINLTLHNDVLYKFTGTLTLDESLPGVPIVVLIASEIKQV